MGFLWALDRGGRGRGGFWRGGLESFTINTVISIGIGDWSWR